MANEHSKIAAFILSRLSSRPLPIDLHPGARIVDAEMYALSEARAIASDSDHLRGLALGRLELLGIKPENIPGLSAMRETETR
ncbi:MAG: hypothetical protein GX139_07930 [Armatimonadetes bacterium]|nr:hypothetical protein [Armatimonadota bacterium]